LNPEAQARLQKLQALQPAPNPEFEAALMHEGVARARRFIAGVKFYQHHPAHRNVSEMPVIWQAGTTRLRDYNPQQPEAPAILVIPSLVNRFDILDLDRNHSFLRALAEQGFRPMVVDWDAPGEEEKDFSLTDYITRRLIPALDIATQTSKRAHILGYCMGGLLALALAALRPEQTRTLTLMATPWDFHKPDPSIGAQFTAMMDQVEPHLEKCGELPVDFIQSLFALFQPIQVLNKFIAAAVLDPAGLEARQFVLLEDWLNDGVPLVAQVARECLRGWYGENQPARMEWSVADRIIDPRSLNIPAYVLVPGKDRIVPPESARPLAKLLPRASLHEPMLGHIGLVVSRNAPQQVWAPLFHWLEKHK
jgi:polyhydroxyalkanoate synthase